MTKKHAFGIATVFALWAWYAFGAADVARKPSLLTLGVWTIGIIYILRGAMLAPELVSIVRGGAVPSRYAVFSLVSLATGVAYVFGVWGLRRQTSHGRGGGRSVARR